MSLFFNICVQILPLCEHFHAFLFSPFSPQKRNKVPASASARKLLHAKCSAVFPSLKQKNAPRLQTFLSLQSLCKSPIDFAIPHISREKITEIIRIPTFQSLKFCKARKWARKCAQYDQTSQNFISGNSNI